MDKDSLLNELKNKYIKGNLVPFIGAGLSVPFNIPGWGTMIKGCAEENGIHNIEGADLFNAIEFDLNRYDYWAAIDGVKKYCGLSESDIQKYVKKQIIQALKEDHSSIKNNYQDLNQPGITTIFTTNYDPLISEYVPSIIHPINLAEVSENIQEIMEQRDDKRIFYLHGNISKPDSIVLSSDSYEKLYKTNNYIKLMELFGGVKTFLFIGFSFNDIYIQKIIKENKEYFKSTHYIILANPTSEQKRYLKEQYSIETISYDPMDSSHTEEISKILSKIFQIEEFDKKNCDFPNLFKDDSLPTKKDKHDMEQNIFCRKLRLENIDDLRVDASKEYFFMAEHYFRWLKKSGIRCSEDIANYILKQVYLKYKDKVLECINSGKSPDELWVMVHNELKTIQLDKMKRHLNIDSMPDEYDKQGFIHVLANDMESEQEVWWGGKRLNEETSN